jgi:LysR family transcriptional regulator for bpeEF and oprC
MDHLAEISIFVRVVEAKSFAAAAAQLNITASGVSRAISRMESRLGARLLYRSTRSLSLTSGGVVFYARCQRILAALEDATDELRDGHSVIAGKLRVGVPLALGRSVLVPHLDHFVRRHPGVRLELLMSDLTSDLTESATDCSIRVGDLPDSSLVARRIGSVQSITCGSPAYFAQHGLPNDAGSLAIHQCIGFIYPNGRYRAWSFELPEGSVDLDLNEYLRVSDVDSMIAMAAGGMGIVQVPFAVAEPMLGDGRLVQVLSDIRPRSKPLWIVYPQRRHLTARVNAFIEWGQELFASAAQSAP